MVKWLCGLSLVATLAFGQSLTNVVAPFVLTSAAGGGGGTRYMPVYSNMQNLNSVATVDSMETTADTVAGINYLLLVTFTINDTATSANYNGRAFTYLGFANNDTLHIQYWGMNVVGVGEHHVGVKRRTAGRMIGTLMYFTGVDTTAPIKTIDTNFITSATPSVTVATADSNLVIATSAFCPAGNTDIVGYGTDETAIAYYHPFTADDPRIRMATSRKTATSTSTTLTHTWEDNRIFTVVGIALQGFAMPGVVTFASKKDTTAIQNVNSFDFQIPFTVSANSNRALVVWTALKAYGKTFPIADSVLVGTSKFTLVDSLARDGNSNAISVWVYVNPPSGSQTVYIKYANNDWPNKAYAHILEYYNVNQGGGTSTIAVGTETVAQTGSSPAYDTLTTTSATNEIVSSWLDVAGGTIDTTGSTLQRGKITLGGWWSTDAFSIVGENSGATSTKSTFVQDANYGIRGMTVRIKP